MLVHTFLENCAVRLPEKTALICDQQRLTYRQLNAAADQLAAALRQRGMKRQDRVVIFLENSIESVIALYGVLKAGGVFVMLNPGMKATKLNFILRDSGARTIITDTAKAPLMKEAAWDTPDVDLIIWCGSSEDPAPPATDITSITWASVFNTPATPSAGPRPLIDVDLATIIYTSGSTGEPKGVVSAHYNMVAAATSITTYLHNVQDDIILNTLPLSFDYGLYQAIMAPLFGGTLLLEKSFAYPYRVMELLVREKVTGFPIVPTMVALLLQMENLQKFDFSSLRYITNTAAALPVAYIHKLRALFPSATLYSMYGLTECKRVAYLPPEELDRRPSSVGIPIPNEEVFIVDSNGKEVAPGEIGELVVRGSNVMQGYWNRPEETAKTFKAGRYRGETLLYTGDFFKRDEEGFLFFVARKDDLIKTKGERVSPKEIENALCSIRGVVEAAVTGVPDEILGQAIKAYLVQDKESSLTLEQVKMFCSTKLESFMVPKYVEFWESLPKSPSGKIDKKLLKALEIESCKRAEDMTVSEAAMIAQNSDSDKANPASPAESPLV